MGRIKHALSWSVYPLFTWECIERFKHLAPRLDARVDRADGFLLLSSHQGNLISLSLNNLFALCFLGHKGTAEVVSLLFLFAKDLI